MATVLLMIFMNETAATLSCERNSRHAPQLAIFKISRKLRVRASATLNLGGIVSNLPTLMSQLAGNLVSIECTNIV